MAKDLQIKDNYLYITDTVTGDVFDQASVSVEIRKKKTASEDFTVFYNDKKVFGLRNIIWSDFTLEGVPFGSQSAFEDWKNTNTGYS
jgi:hypothetical protein